MALAYAGARAEVPVLRPDELRQHAAHILVGRLVATYRSVETGDDFERTSGIAEIVAEKVEKGDGLKVGEVTFVRFWNQRWVGKGEVPPHSGGHDVPAVGTVVRAHLKRGRDGSYEALLPNGLTVVEKPTPRSR
jgi:hypothetical protein